MLDEVYDELRENYEAVIQGLQRELGKLRTGRANLGMLRDIRVEYYGQQVPLNQVASMKVADARMITLSPWESTMIGPIERAIASSDLGFNPSNDGTIIRVPVPALTRDRRMDLVKIAKRIGEDHKISLRNHRRDANDMIKELERESEISKDDMHRAMASVDQITGEFSTRADEVVKSKEEDILEI